MAQILPFIGPIISGITGIASGISGHKAANQAQKTAQENQAIYNRMAEGNLGTLDFLRDTMSGFQNPQLADQVLRSAQGLGGNLTDIANRAAGQIGGGGYMGQVGDFNEYSFQPVQTTLDQTRQFVNEMGQTARTQATDQAALATRQQGDMLDAALAGRGFSRNSGAAAAALSDFGQQSALQRSQLEGSLAQMAGEMGLQSGQFDAQNAIQMAGLGSNYNLGMNQLRSQTGLALQGLHDQQALSRAQLQMGAAQGGHDALQNTYAQNYLNPMIGLASPLATLGSYMGGYAQSGLDNVHQGQRAGAQAGGAGFGAGFMGMANQFSNPDFLSLIMGMTSPQHTLFTPQQTSFNTAYTMNAATPRGR